MSTTPTLDPNKIPWKRGDACTLHFQKPGYVVNPTHQHFEVLWSDDTTQIMSANEIEDLIRLGHADSLGPDGKLTNLEALQKLEALNLIQRNLTERIKTQSESERRSGDRLVRRIFSEGTCKWDASHKNELYMLLIVPESVGVLFKMREWIHRFFCTVK